MINILSVPENEIPQKSSVLGLWYPTNVSETPHVSLANFSVY